MYFFFFGRKLGNLTISLTREKQWSDGVKPGVRKRQGECEVGKKKEREKKNRNVNVTCFIRPHEMATKWESFQLRTHAKKKKKKEGYSALNTFPLFTRGCIYCNV